ncbi:uncharacterized protein Nmag_3676 (plasmid) [Natrialba magadii ATCC 43099]|uniref:Uncharacterized protein n=1 Tax=Natrialba magadii (strain ATCC 43099 / DSM 3394 / CCM 3739 / CIP 104546 / IAM 13178 / JCM 8861 / NBRC 102185 / NCIMB 2190 / MS3) TaxID=547559 RepID=D3T0W3_NATMM|nr:hypothetical protein [Natrialba magadii]ADD07222.1 uncharacterized protein Nmag_3676 [Natrialba magadii ATCC 43099]ELY34334.1 hypothetical protein C500_00327 [Natrialba magadii ATCC 43099]
MDDSERALLEATYRALCEYGYVDLTMQGIVDEPALRKTIVDGVDVGEFDDHANPDLTVDLSTTASKGAHTRQVAGSHQIGCTCGAACTFVVTSLVGENASEVTT